MSIDAETEWRERKRREEEEAWRVNALRDEQAEMELLELLEKEEAVKTS